jgi:hypothetical protein
MDIATSFLRSLDVVTTLSGSARLSADQVRGLGTALGLSDSDILNRVYLEKRSFSSSGLR